MPTTRDREVALSCRIRAIPGLTRKGPVPRRLGVGGTGKTSCPPSLVLLPLSSPFSGPHPSSHPSSCLPGLVAGGRLLLPPLLSSARAPPPRVFSRTALVPALLARWGRCGCLKQPGSARAFSPRLSPLARSLAPCRARMGAPLASRLFSSLSSSRLLRASPPRASHASRVLAPITRLSLILTRFFAPSCSSLSRLGACLLAASSPGRWRRVAPG